MRSMKWALIRQILGARGCLLMCLSLAGCASETLFQSGFNASPVGGPPAPTQTVGTARVDGAVSIVEQSVGSRQHWVRISRPVGNGDPIGSFYGRFSRTGADGHYGLVLAIKVGGDIIGNVPANAMMGAASIELRPGPTDRPFLLHLDFRPKQPAGQMIRINDDSALTFGTFEADQTFTLSVGIDVNGSTATASVRIIGAGVGNDSFKENIALPNAGIRLPLGAVQLWMGAPWGGHFDATDIVVTYKPCRRRSMDELRPCRVEPERRSAAGESASQM